MFQHELKRKNRICSTKGEFYFGTIESNLKYGGEDL